jgi:hypothetical protein
MSFNSLTNLSVKPADGNNAVLLMPKLQYRFRVTLLGFASGSSTELTKQVVSVSRHTVGFEEVVLDVYNSKVYLAGKPKFEPLKLVVRDDANGVMQELVGMQIQKQFDVLNQATARSGVDYKFTMKVEILDGGNGSTAAQTLETSMYYGCFIANAEYGQLEYKSNEPVTVTLTIRFDNLEQWAKDQETTTTTGGIGAAVSRSTTSSASTGSSMGTTTTTTTPT